MGESLFRTDVTTRLNRGAGYLIHRNTGRYWSAEAWSSAARHLPRAGLVAADADELAMKSSGTHAVKCIGLREKN